MEPSAVAAMKFSRPHPSSLLRFWQCVGTPSGMNEAAANAKPSVVTTMPGILSACPRSERRSAVSIHAVPSARRASTSPYAHSPTPAPEGTPPGANLPTPTPNSSFSEGILPASAAAPDTFTARPARVSKMPVVRTVFALLGDRRIPCGSGAGRGIFRSGFCALKRRPARSSPAYGEGLHACGSSQAVCQAQPTRSVLRRCRRFDSACHIPTAIAQPGSSSTPRVPRARARRGAGDGRACRAGPSGTAAAA